MTKSQLFIEPDVDLQKGDPALSEMVNLSKESLNARWDSENGKYILDKWRESDFDRDVLDDLVGKYYGHTDLRGIDLSNENLSSRDLKNIDFYSSNFEDTNFKASDLSDSWLSETNIKGANFNWAKMDSVLLDNVDFDSRTTFVGVNLNAINFTLAALLQDLAVGQQRIAHLKKRHPYFSNFLRITCDYGRSFKRFFLWCVGIIFFFAVIYWILPNMIHNIDGENSLANSLYFSVVTFTTLGYGDIYPISVWGRIVVIGEVITGYIMSGLLIAILARRIIGN